LVVLLVFFGEKNVFRGAREPLSKWKATEGCWSVAFQKVPVSFFSFFKERSRVVANNTWCTHTCLPNMCFTKKCVIIIIQKTNKVLSCISKKPYTQPSLLFSSFFSKKNERPKKRFQWQLQQLQRWPIRYLMLVLEGM